MTDIIVGFVFGIVITCWTIYFALKIAERRLERQIDELVEAVKTTAENIIQARVEQQGDVFYLYDSKTDHFLAQGDNLAQLRERLESRYRNKNIFVTEGDPEVLARLKATKEVADA